MAADSDPAGASTRDQHVFLRALDALQDGLAFYDSTGKLISANRAFEEALRGKGEEASPRDEVDHFVFSLVTLVRMRRRIAAHVEELAVREIPLHGERWFLRGSYIGFDLFRRGRSLLVQLERISAAPATEEMLRTRFGLTRAECRIAKLLADGKSNAEIARRLFLSPHTVHTHTKRIFDKLDVRSRAEVGARLQRI